MPALIKCKHCSGTVASSALKCPHCGGRVNISGCGGLIIIVAAILGVMAFVGAYLIGMIVGR